MTSIIIITSAAATAIATRRRGLLPVSRGSWEWSLGWVAQGLPERELGGIGGGGGSTSAAAVAAGWRGRDGWYGSRFGTWPGEREALRCGGGAALGTAGATPTADAWSDDALASGQGSGSSFRGDGWGARLGHLLLLMLPIHRGWAFSCGHIHMYKKCRSGPRSLPGS